MISGNFRLFLVDCFEIVFNIILMFSMFDECSATFRIFPATFRMFPDFSGFSRIFPDFSGFSRNFPDFSGFSRIFPDFSGHRPGISGRLPAAARPPPGHRPAAARKIPAAPRFHRAPSRNIGYYYHY